MIGIVDNILALNLVWDTKKGKMIKSSNDDIIKISISDIFTYYKKPKSN